MTNVFHKLCQKHNATYLARGESCHRCFIEQRAAAVYIGANVEPHEWRNIRGDRDKLEKQVVKELGETATLDWVRSDGEFHRKMELVTACAKASLVKGDSSRHDLKDHYIHRGLFHSSDGRDYKASPANMRDILGTLFDEKFPSFKPFLVAELPRTEPVATQRLIIELNNSEEFQEDLKYYLVHYANKNNLTVRERIRSVVSDHVDFHEVPRPSGFLKLATKLYAEAYECHPRALHEKNSGETARLDRVRSDVEFRRKMEYVGIPDTVG